MIDFPYPVWLRVVDGESKFCVVTPAWKREVDNGFSAKIVIYCSISVETIYEADDLSGASVPDY